MSMYSLGSGAGLDRLLSGQVAQGTLPSSNREPAPRPCNRSIAGIDFPYTPLRPVRALVSVSPVSQTSWLARNRAPFCLSVMFPALLSLAVPATAWADIYKWTDENGTTHFSNTRPDRSAKTKEVEVVIREAKPASSPDRPATRTEQVLLARVESLERQLDARQYAAQAPQAPPPATYSGYYPPAPPPSSYYTGGYDWTDSGYYPAYYYPFASSYVVYPRRAFVRRPVFVAPHAGSFRGHGGHAGGGRGGRR